MNNYNQLFLVSRRLLSKSFRIITSDNKKQLKILFNSKQVSDIFREKMKTQRIQTIERRLLIAFQTKRKELLFRFSVSYVIVHTHASTFPMPRFLRFLFIFYAGVYPTYLSAHRSRASLSFFFLFLSLHNPIFLFFLHFVAVHAKYHA